MYSEIAKLRKRLLIAHIADCACWATFGFIVGQLVTL